ncbi:hypothetical protein CTA1_1165 [Colletotrichum tanaceti]|uniref:Uncharacterized protein n=1 Tax=Colletotrichum tanaceti TaxID=1306861 RepID=A0A4U6X2Q8_9PEZI|nr:hypothetical protein CTA1_1165 [Colletotrichum tanaceti]
MGKRGGIQRKHVLTNLIQARPPETGERIASKDLEAEAFGYDNLLHNPEALRKCVDEVDGSLTSSSSSSPDDGKEACSIAEVENSLPFLRWCVKENYRLTPVFTMPLARRVTSPEGIMAAGRHMEQGCLGKTLAQSNIYKLAGFLLRDFDFRLADPVEEGQVARGQFSRETAADD